MIDQTIKHDKLGRMLYHPDYHHNQYTPWNTTDHKFLVDNYNKLGPEEVSLALGRTMTSVMQRAYELRKSGEMTKPEKQLHTIRHLSPCKRNMKRNAA